MRSNNMKHSMAVIIVAYVLAWAQLQPVSPVSQTRSPIDSAVVKKQQNKTKPVRESKAMRPQDSTNTIKNTGKMPGDTAGMQNRIIQAAVDSGKQDIIKGKINPYPIEMIPGPDSVLIPVLDFKNTDVRDILRAMGMQYKINIFLEPDVSGVISLYLVDMPVKRALDFIVRRANLAYVVENGIVKISKYSTPAPAPQRAVITFHRHDGVLDIDAKGATLAEITSLFVDSIGLNVVTDKTIEFEKQVTIHTRNLRPEKALKVLCETNGLEYNVNDGVYYLSKQRWGEDNKGQVSPGLKMLSITVTKENKVTLEVNNADLDQVIRSIVLQSGINVIIYETISGAASAKVDSLPLDDVLRFLLQNTKYTFWRDKSIYFIGSREMSQQKTTVEVQCKYIMADEEEITKLLPPSITKEAVIKFDKEHNAVIIIGSFDIVAQAQEYFEKIDQPVPQVLIEALVVDFNISKTREYGLDLFIPDTFSQTVQHYFPYIQANVASKTIQHALNEIIKLIRPNDIITLPANFMGMMTVLEDADIAKVLSTPQIATLNGNTASIVIGETRYFKLEEKTSQLTQQTPVTISTDRFEKYQFDNKLEVTPWVMADRYVTVKIKPEFNIPRTKENTDIPPTADKRALESTVRLKDGQTIVLGGQRSTSETSSTQGIPFLASIPILGKLFSHEKTVKNETQMMIFLTPHVYYKDEAGINPQDYFKSKIEDLQTEKVIKNQKEKCKK